MFVELSNYPLPFALECAAATPQRRHHAGPVDLHGPAFGSFVRVAEALAQTPVQLDADRVASAARWLIDHCASGHNAPCVHARMHVAAALRAMRAEPGWQPAPELVPLLHRLLAYLDDPGRLIPSGLPVIGHLDDAILLDLVWPRIEGGLREYMDFRRLRRIETELGNTAPSRSRFTRRDWLASRETERRLRRQLRRSGLAHYADGASDASRFCVN